MNTTHDNPLATMEVLATNLFVEPITSDRPSSSEEPVDTNPIPWRWLDRHGVPLEERGGCILYSLSTFHHPTPACLLHERDVVDNGTIMCIRPSNYIPDLYSLFSKERHSVLCPPRHCQYGNETMKAVLEMRSAYQEATCGHMRAVAGPLLYFSLVFITFIYPYLIWKGTEKCSFRLACNLSLWVASLSVCLPFMLFLCNQLEYWLC